MKTKTELLYEIASLMDFEIHPYHVQTDLESHVVGKALKLCCYNRNYEQVTDLLEEYWK